MLANIYNSLQSIVSFFSLVFSTVTDFFTSIPKFLSYISDLVGAVPACLAGFCGIALSLLLANKILSLI